MDIHAASVKSHRMAVALKIITAASIAVLLLAGVVMTLEGLRSGKRHCKRMVDTDDIKFYRWSCYKYYLVDFETVYAEIALLSLILIILSLGLKKTMQLPVVGLTVTVTVFLFLGMQKYSDEKAEKGLFLKPIVHNDPYFSGFPTYSRTYMDSPVAIVSRGKVYDLSRDKIRMRHRQYQYNYGGVVDSFKIIELKGVYTKKATRRVVFVGYCLTAAGNILLMFVLGMGEWSSMSNLEKLRTRVKEIRSQLTLLKGSTMTASMEDELRPLGNGDESNG